MSDKIDSNYNPPRAGKVFVEGDGYLYIGCVRVAQVVDGCVIVHDKNRHRSLATGSNKIAVSTDDFVEAITLVSGVESCDDKG